MGALIIVVDNGGLVVEMIENHCITQKRAVWIFYSKLHH